MKELCLSFQDDDCGSEPHDDDNNKPRDKRVKQHVQHRTNNRSHWNETSDGRQSEHVQTSSSTSLVDVILDVILDVTMDVTNVVTVPLIFTRPLGYNFDKVTNF